MTTTTKTLCAAAAALVVFVYVQHANRIAMLPTEAERQQCRDWVAKLEQINSFASLRRILGTDCEASDGDMYMDSNPYR